MHDDVLSEIAQRLSTHRQKLGRIFLCCMTGQQMVMITDRREIQVPGELGYDNLFIPTVCGRCEPILLQDGYHKEKFKPIKLHRDLIEGWKAFEAVKNWCGSNVTGLHTLTDPLAVIGMCGRYTMGMGSVQVTTDEAGRPTLEVLSYVDPSFIPDPNT